MNERIIMEPDTIYRPRIQVQYATLYKLLNYCKENQLRFGQALCNIIKSEDPFTIEDDDLDRKIQEFISKQID